MKKDSKLSKLVTLLIVIILSTQSIFSAYEISQHKTNRFDTPIENHTVVLTKRSVMLDEEGEKVFLGFLKGVEFELFQITSTGDTSLGIFVTDENGEIWVHELKAGKYYFREKRIPSDHTSDIDDEGRPITKYEFEIFEDSDELIYIEVDNIRKTVNLLVSKEIINGDGSEVTEDQKEEEFSFRVVIGDDPDDGKVYIYSIDGGSDLEFINGDIIKLKHGQTATFKDIPVGLKYTVTEIKDHDYIISSTNATGILLQDAHAHFINRRIGEELGELAIQKIVENHNGDPLTEEQLNKEFEFTITFSDGESYLATIDDGQAFTVHSGDTFKLKHEQIFRVLDMPLGITYTIVEKDYTDDGYYTINKEITGDPITGDDIPVHIVKNIYREGEIPEDEMGQLVIRKHVTGTNKQDEFEFFVSFDPEIEVQYQINDGPLIDHDPSVSIVIKGGDEIRFIDIPIGTRYDIKETAHPNYEAGVITASGIIILEEVIVDFYNNYKTPEVDPGEALIRVLKRVEGTTTDKEFEFVLKYEDQEIEFKLKDGESIDFVVPANVEYTVIEKDYTSEGFELVITNSSGTTVEFELIEVLAINKYHEELERIKVEGKKIWKLPNGNVITLPPYIEIELWVKNSHLVEKIKVYPKEDGTWHYSFNVPKYNPDGSLIEYVVKELVPEGFEVEYDGDTIINSYTRPITYIPNVEKELVYESGKPEVDQTFKFKIEPIDGAPIQDRSPIEITGSGRESFAEIKFRKAGVYQYQITEVMAREQYYTFDTIPVILTVVVEKEDYQLVIKSVTYSKDTYVDKTEEAYFLNTYKEPIKPVPPEPPVKPDPVIPPTGINNNDTDAYYYLLTMVIGLLVLTIGMKQELIKKRNEW